MNESESPAEAHGRSSTKGHVSIAHREGHKHGLQLLNGVARRAVREKSCSWDIWQLAEWVSDHEGKGRARCSQESRVRRAMNRLLWGELGVSEVMHSRMLVEG